jgi:hypothetical protein
MPESSRAPLSLQDVLSLLTPSRMVQVAAKLEIEAKPTESPEEVARRAGAAASLRPALDALYRGELQKLCEQRGVDRAGAVYDQDLVEKLLA